jgi:hypothetical protein
MKKTRSKKSRDTVFLTYTTQSACEVVEFNNVFYRKCGILTRKWMQSPIKNIRVSFLKVIRADSFDCKLTTKIFTYVKGSLWLHLKAIKNVAKMFIQNKLSVEDLCTPLQRLETNQHQIKVFFTILSLFTI